MAECSDVHAFHETQATPCIAVGEDGNIQYPDIEGGGGKDTADDTESSSGSTSEQARGASNPAATKGWNVAFIIVLCSIGAWRMN